MHAINNLMQLVSWMRVHLFEVPIFRVNKLVQPAESNGTERNGMARNGTERRMANICITSGLCSLSLSLYSSFSVFWLYLLDHLFPCVIELFVFKWLHADNKRTNKKRAFRYHRYTIFFFVRVHTVVVAVINSTVYYCATLIAMRASINPW